MRETTASGIRLQYPDEVSFAFMPFRLVLSGANLKSMLVVATVGNQSLSAKYDAINGNLYADIREYLSTFFDGVKWGDIAYNEEATNANTAKSCRINVYARKTDNTQVEFNFATSLVWGAMKFGETWNGFHEWRWFTKYPATIGLYANDEGTLVVGENGSPTRELTIEGAGQIYNFTLKADDYTAGTRFLSVYDVQGLITQATFDHTFDLTFYAPPTGEQTEVRRLILDDCDYENGYYLRWIDRHGFYRYWLFKSLGDYSAKIESKGEFLRNNILAYDDASFGYKWHAGRNQSYARNEVCPICAPLVDSATWDALLDICSSPVVDLFVGYKDSGEPIWLAVTTEQGTYTKGAEALQDFIVNLVFPQTQTQAL